MRWLAAKMSILASFQVYFVIKFVYQTLFGENIQRSHNFFALVKLYFPAIMFFKKKKNYIRMKCGVCENIFDIYFCYISFFHLLVIHIRKFYVCSPYKH